MASRVTAIDESRILSRAALKKWGLVVRDGLIYTATGHRKVYASGRMKGRIALRVPTHPNADATGHVYLHTIVAVEKLGYSLGKGWQVHHADENPANNHPDNLVVCRSQAEHSYLHYRARMAKKYGDANAIECRFCKKRIEGAFRYDPKGNHHPECVRPFTLAKVRRLRERRKAMGLTVRGTKPVKAK